mgnify:CR=1 FL=1
MLHRGDFAKAGKLYLIYCSLLEASFILVSFQHFPFCRDDPLWQLCRCSTRPKSYAFISNVELQSIQFLMEELGNMQFKRRMQFVCYVVGFLTSSTAVVTFGGLFAVALAVAFILCLRTRRLQSRGNSYSILMIF